MRAPAEFLFVSFHTKSSTTMSNQSITFIRSLFYDDVLYTVVTKSRRKNIVPAYKSCEKHPNTDCIQL